MPDGGDIFVRALLRHICDAMMRDDRIGNRRHGGNRRRRWLLDFSAAAAPPAFPASRLAWNRGARFAEALMLHGVEPVATFFTPIAWSAYILIADAAVLALTGRSRLNDAPIVLARMALLSIPLWLIFEGYNCAAAELDLRRGAARTGRRSVLAMAGHSRPSRRRFSRRRTWWRRCCRLCRAKQWNSRGDGKCADRSWRCCA